MAELIPSPHEQNKGASADTGRYLQAVALAGQLGKTVEEVLAFMGESSINTLPLQVVPNFNVPQQVNAPKVELPKELKNKVLPLPTVSEETTNKTDKRVVQKETINNEDDGFIVTEILDPSEASEQDLQKLSEQEEEEEQDWDGKIRVGSKVKIVYQVAASKINWVGKKGKVTRVIGNESAKVYEVEFKGAKIPKIQLNKKTGKLEKGYVPKTLRNTFSEDQVELAD